MNIRQVLQDWREANQKNPPKTSDECWRRLQDVEAELGPGKWLVHDLTEQYSRLKAKEKRGKEAN